MCTIETINRLTMEQHCHYSSGSYRDAFRFQRQTPPDHFVMKRMLASRSVGAKVISRIHKEAIILERLSSSPRILDIYSYCGGSVFVEQMASDLHTKIVYGNGVDSQERLDTLDNVYPQNNLTASEKLQISLEMAKSLADIHGFEGGPIVHADTHIEQWLIAPDGNIKLNDFNNGEFFVYLHSMYDFN
jgi:serine/threonine protein kinase